MTTPSDDSASPELDSTPARPDWNVESKPRVVTLPAHLRNIPSCEGTPDLFNTYLINIGLALLFGTMFTGLLVSPFYDGSFFNKGVIVFILWLVLLGVIAYAVTIFIRGARRAGAWFEVDSTGFRYGLGARPKSAAIPKEQCFEWREAVANPSLRYDVEYNTASRVTMSAANFQFWRRATREPATAYTLRKNLIPTDADDAIRCAGFKNRHDLLVAILCGLAHQGLRFNRNTFVAAGIHPETWQKLRTPWRAAVACFSILVALGLLAFFIWGRLSLPFSFAIWIVSLLYYCGEGKYDFSPDLKNYPRGPIVFRIDDSETAEESRH
ncbi:hypothetical protein [Burkholderia pyrrocinia]|uniref:hypothetical protein n=1 Tax=Burkholderia pyrrocinia TaxID=60550 RepID=UPI002AB28929|nr:hypothetical protein [Burkholderia pyrrocinia]